MNKTQLHRDTHYYVNEWSCWLFEEPLSAAFTLYSPQKYSYHLHIFIHTYIQMSIRVPNELEKRAKNMLLKEKNTAAFIDFLAWVVKVEKARNIEKGLEEELKVKLYFCCCCCCFVFFFFYSVCSKRYKDLFFFFLYFWVTKTWDCYNWMTDWFNGHRNVYKRS